MFRGIFSSLKAHGVWRISYWCGIPGSKVAFEGSGVRLNHRPPISSLVPGPLGHNYTVKNVHDNKLWIGSIIEGPTRKNFRRQFIILTKKIDLYCFLNLFTVIK